MEKHILLEQLQILLRSVPDWDNFKPSSATDQEWLGRAYALVHRWRPMEADMSFSSSTTYLTTATMRNMGVNTIMGLIHRAIQDIKVDLECNPKQVFGPGAVYDFFKAYSDLMETAKSTILIVDPYLDIAIFDAYIGRIKAVVKIMLLSARTKYENDLRVAFKKYEAQHNRGIQIRLANNPIHDRVTIIDSKTCWVLGQSIKDAASKSPTYMVPISQDYVDLKIAEYDKIWGSSIDL